MGNVVIAPNIRKESVRIDPAGNELNPRTKQIVKPVEAEYVPPVPAIPTPSQETVTVNLPSNPLSIQDQIDEAKANLEKLQELKKLKIAEMEAQLELLKQ